MRLKKVILWNGMPCYAILCYNKVWKVWYAMRFLSYAMRFLCYSMVYDVNKDEHSATVVKASPLIARQLVCVMGPLR